MDDLPDSPVLPDALEIVPLEPHHRVGGDSTKLRRRLGQLAADRRARLVATGLVCVALLSLLLVQVIPGARQDILALLGHSTPAIVVRSSVSLTVQVTPVVTPLLGPSLTPIPPVMGPLPPPPANCPSPPPLDSIIAQPGGFDSPVQLYGRSPIWIPAGYFPDGTITVGQPGVYQPYQGTKIIWEVGPTRFPQFSAQVSDVATGAPAYWGSGNASSVASVLSIPGHDSDVPPSAVPAYFGVHTGLIFTHSGCYKLDVSWSGGEWYTIFAVGGTGAQ